MKRASRRLLIAAVATPTAAAMLVVALVVTAFAALAATGGDDGDPAASGSVCAAEIARVGVGASGVDAAALCAGGAAGPGGSGAGTGNGSIDGSGGASDGVAAGGWGGFSNGQIPASALCPLSAAGQLLRCDAATAWNAMSAADQADTGSPMCITDSYRTLAVQVRLRAEKPTLAAVPGTSNHGWALAVDLCEPGRAGMGYTTPTYRWLKANAASFGWVHPAWAEPGRGQQEPWHWEYVGGTS